MSITNLGDGYFNAKPNEYTDYIYDSNGKLILENTNSSIEYLGDDLFAIKNENNKIKVVNKDNEIFIPYESNYSRVQLSEEDIFIAEFMDNTLNVSVQYLKINGKPLIDDVFEKAYSFEDGAAVVFKNNNAGVIDKNGNEIIEFKFNNLSQFKNGTSIANLNNKYGIIDTEGEFTIEPKYKGIFPCSYNELYIAELDGKYGVIDKNDNIKIPFEYDMIYNLNKNVFHVELDNKISLVNKENKVILPLDEYIKADVYYNMLLTQKENNLKIIDLKNKNVLFEELNLIAYATSTTKDNKVITAWDKDSNTYYLNTETCEIVYK